MGFIELAKKLTTISIGERAFTHKEALVREKQKEKDGQGNMPKLNKKKNTITIPLDRITPQQKNYLEGVEKMRASKSLNKPNRPVKNGNAQGWFTVGKVKFFARSDWERKYAFYLECCKGVLGIFEWEYEPETFWFTGIKRGVNNYKPDFGITYKDGRVEYHEVKGFYDSKSKTKIKRMKKYHPEVTLVVVDKVWFDGVWKLYKDRYKKIYG